MEPFIPGLRKPLVFLVRGFLVDKKADRKSVGFGERVRELSLHPFQFRDQGVDLVDI